jgi:two-component system osmolarity sensor histidine kinase EnvZ
VLYNFKNSTLFSRNLIALGFGFSFFALFIIAVLHLTLVKPQIKLAADDLAAFLVLSAKIWVELPPATRHDFEIELFEKHNIRLIRLEAPLPVDDDDHPYLEFLQESLKARLNQKIIVHRHEQEIDWLWVDFPISGHIIRLGFHESRLQNNMILLVIGVVIAGILLAFAISVLLVRRVVLPLENMALATQSIGKGEFSVKLAETGPYEIAELAKKINQMNEQIQILIENRTTLLAGISHDLRTPLTRIRLELEMLDHDQNQALIDEISQDLEEMEHLISQTLLLARHNTDENIQTVDINVLIRDLIDKLRHNENMLIFKGCTDKCIHPVRVDALNRVLINLIENALNYSNGLPVNVSCSCNQNSILLEVSDQGPGIPADQHKAVFQPFYRLESSRSKATGGSGLGLAIVRQLCNANDWNTEIVSPAAGGTKVQIVLPRSVDQG